VHVQFVGESDEVEQYIRHLQSNLRERDGRQTPRLFCGQPLEVLQELRGLDTQGRREILRRMEAVPVSLGGKPPKRLTDVFYLGHYDCGGWIVHALKTFSLCHCRYSAFGRQPGS